MNILTLDDERIMLEVLTTEVKKVFVGENVKGFQNWEDAMIYVKELVDSSEKLDYAFLDIRLRGTTGIDIAKTIKNLDSDTKIIFCTGYSEYACEAWSSYPKGYLLKPIKKDAIEKNLDEMVANWREQSAKLTNNVCVQTFGNFEIFLNGKPIKFEREKAKELLAYLVDRKGAAATTPEIAAILWEDKVYDQNTRSQTTRTVSVLRKTLKQAGIENLLVKTWNHIAIDVNKIKCDAYDFENGDISAINSYRGEYMTNYSWAEFGNAKFTSEILK